MTVAPIEPVNPSTSPTANDAPLEPITDQYAGLICPACNQQGYRQRPDDRGVLVRHPGRAWPCRVAGVFT